MTIPVCSKQKLIPLREAYDAIGNCHAIGNITGGGVAAKVVLIPLLAEGADTARRWRQACIKSPL